MKLNKKVPPEAQASIPQITEPGALADNIAQHLAVKIGERQQLLEIFNVVKRLEKVYALMEGEISVLQVEKKIRTRVKRQMEKTQREYYLNEQMKAIQRELGEHDDSRDELIELEKRIKKTKLSKEARTKAESGAEEAAQHEPDVGGIDGGAELPRLAAVDPVGQGQDQADRRGEGRADPRGGPLRPGEGQGAHPGVPGGAGAHRLAEGADPLPGGPARRRQDLARPLDRQGDGARVRAAVAGRRARRGRDPRPPAHLHRLDARQDRAVDEEGQDHQHLLPARRDRQDGRRLAGRSVQRAAGGAGPGTEQHLQRPLPGGRLRPLAR